MGGESVVGDEGWDWRCLELVVEGMKTCGMGGD